MTFVWLTSKGAGAIWSGAAAAGGLGVLAALGWLIRLFQPALALRKYHRYMGFVFFALYFLHVAIAD